MRPYLLIACLALSSCAASQCPLLYMNRTRGGAPCYFTDEYGHAVFGNARYEDARQFIGDRAAVRLNGKWGFIDPSGATAVPLQYDWCGSFGEYGFDKSVAMVKNEVDKFKVPILSDCPTALIDRKGNRVTPFYGFIFPVRDKVAFVNDGRTDFADTRLQNLGFADGKWGCIDPKGRLVVPCVYELAYLLIATPGFNRPARRQVGRAERPRPTDRPVRLRRCLLQRRAYRYRHAGRHGRSRKERRGSERRFPGKTALYAERGRNRDFHRERPTGARSINAAANK